MSIQSIEYGSMLILYLVMVSCGNTILMIEAGACCVDEDAPIVDVNHRDEMMNEFPMCSLLTHGKQHRD